jgi:hypothetical protein
MGRTTSFVPTIDEPPEEPIEALSLVRYRVAVGADWNKRALMSLLCVRCNVMHLPTDAHAFQERFWRRAEYTTISEFLPNRI